MVEVVLVHPIDSEEAWPVAIAKLKVESETSTPIVIVVAKLPKELELNEVKVDVRAIGLAGCKNSPPHEVVIDGLLVMNALSKPIVS